MVSGPFPPADPEATEARTEAEAPPRSRSPGADANPTQEGRDLYPIGPERLRKLREQIRNGTYPTEKKAVEGLVTMFLGRRHRPRASGAKD